MNKSEQLDLGIVRVNFKRFILAKATTDALKLEDLKADGPQLRINKAKYW